MRIPSMGAILAAGLLPLLSAAQPLSLRDAGGLRYACGGVGAEERRELQALRRPGQLEILFASAARGAYLADVEVEVVSRAGGAPARFRAAGPTCLVEAPAGRYRVTGRLGATERGRDVNLPRSGAKVVLTFPDEPWDGIRASEAEKRQAREP